MVVRFIILLISHTFSMITSIIPIHNRRVWKAAPSPPPVGGRPGGGRSLGKRLEFGICPQFQPCYRFRPPPNLPPTGEGLQRLPLHLHYIAIANWYYFLGTSSPSALKLRFICSGSGAETST